jgi:hypothetical protein
MRSTDLFGSIRTPETLSRTLDRLIDGWCERRSLAPLRLVLPWWPLSSPLTDAWGDLLTALKQVELLPDSDLTDTKRAEVGDARRFVERVVYDR